jgi:hypothetical protein
MATRKRQPARNSVRRGRASKSKSAPRRAAARPAQASSTRKRTATTPVARGEKRTPQIRTGQIAAFISDARHATDALAEELGESFVLNATCGEDPEEFYESERPEEEGGPFLETSGRVEFGYGVDESNPEDAEPAPWPSVSVGEPPPHRPGGPR